MLLEYSVNGGSPQQVLSQDDYSVVFLDQANKDFVIEMSSISAPDLSFEETFGVLIISSIALFFFVRKTIN